ncbi:MAG: NAD(P)-binding domain-containing protein [bacterium]
MLEKLINVISITITITIPVLYVLYHSKKAKQAREKLAEATSTGLTEPVSLHPKIDPNSCISAGACVSACPEGEILGILNGRAELVSPTKCIGHGACQSACPVDAIELVFGTERRGVEIPHVKKNFETNMPGLYIAGELGGMGLIRNAMTQGREAIEYLAPTLNGHDSSVYDVAIVGAGPAGLAATLQAKKQRLRYITLEQDDIGGTILTYPRQKLVMTQPMEIPLFGSYKRREVQKEELLSLWYGIVKKSGIRVHTHEKIENVEKINGHYEITSSQGSYLAQRIVLSIGRRGTPRKLGVPGEKSTKVAYKLIEPVQYRNKRILVIGGGDSAIEAALSLSEQPGTRVTLSYRKDVFSRIKEKNQQRIEQAILAGAVHVVFNSNVLAIRPESVILKQNEKEGSIENDFVFIFAGGELPTKFLQKLGIQIEKKFGER